MEGWCAASGVRSVSRSGVLVGACTNIRAFNLLGGWPAATIAVTERLQVHRNARAVLFHQVLYAILKLFGLNRAGVTGDAAGAEATRVALDGTWKTVLLNQFHDILPGSSIKEVYDDAREQFGEVRRDALRVVQGGMAWLGEVVAGAAVENSSAQAEKLVVFNPASTAQSGTLATEEGDVLAIRVPAFGIQVIDPARHTPRGLVGVQVL